MRLKFIVLGFALLVAAAPVSAATDREIAERFAPIFYQALGDKPRSDYPTNFNFDGDWRGDNNWKNTDDLRFPLLGYIYFSVSQTRTHYFVHYAVFHPRDYKGGEKFGPFLSDVIRAGTDILKKKDPTGRAAEATMAHENDMEGALVVAEKSGDDLASAKLVYVETLAHNQFNAYALRDSGATAVGEFRSEGDQVLLYIEPKGHGIYAYSGAEKERGAALLEYRFTGRADDPESRGESDTTGYDLVPIESTLWPKARSVSEKGTTFGLFQDYGSFTISYLQGKDVVQRKVQVGKLASAFLGGIGGVNMARPPWGWFSNSEKKDPLGLWFFDPAKVVKRDFALSETFSTVYTRLPFWAEGKAVGK